MTLEDKYWAAGFLDGTNASPAYENKSKSRYAWKWEFAPPLNNDLLLFFKDNFGAKIVKVKQGQRYDISIRFTKTALVEIIKKIGPYLRARRKIFEEIAKSGTRLNPLVGGGELERSNVPIKFPPQEFDTKYQKYYGAGVLEASATPYIAFREDKYAKFGSTLQRTLRVSEVMEKLLNSMGVKYSYVNLGKKPQILKSEDILKVLSYAENEIKFRKELIDFIEVVKKVSIPAGTPKTIRGKVIYEGMYSEQAIIEKNNRNRQLVEAYDRKVNNYVFDESLIETGIDGKIIAQQNKERKKWAKERKILYGQALRLEKIKKRRSVFTVRRLKSIEKKQQSIIRLKSRLDKIGKKINEIVSDKATCRCCKKSKLKIEFHIQNNNYHGVSLYCKECVSKKGKLRLQDPKVKERNRQRNRQYYLDNKEKIIAYTKEYSKTYVQVKDDYDKYVEKTRIGSGNEFWKSKKEIKDFGITVHRVVALSKNDFFMHLEEEWRLLPVEIKDHYELPHELTAEEIFKLRREGFIDLDHIIPKAKIKKLAQQGHAKGCEVYPNHGLNIRPLPKKLNCQRSASLTLFSYYPDYKKRIKRILRAVFQKY